MTLINRFKYFLPFILFLLLILLLLNQYFELRSLRALVSADRSSVQEELHSFRADLGRSSVRIANDVAELKALVGEIPPKIQEDIDKWNLLISSISKFKFKAESSSSGSVKRVTIPETPPSSCDWDYSDWRLTGNFKDQCGEGVFTYKLSQTFSGTLLSADSSLGKPSYLKVWELGPSGEEVPDSVKLILYETVRLSAPSDKFHLLAPHLDIGFALSYSTDLTFSGSLGVSLSGYGSTPDDLSWRFLRAAVERSSLSPSLGLCPASYNLGKHLPLFNNIWVSPCYSFSSHPFNLTFSAIL